MYPGVGLASPFNLQSALGNNIVTGCLRGDTLHNVAGRAVTKYGFGTRSGSPCRYTQRELGGRSNGSRHAPPTRLLKRPGLRPILASRFLP